MKASNAAKAIEELNGTFLLHYGFKLKVMISHSIRERSKERSDVDKYYQKMLQITVSVPRDYLIEDIVKEFNLFGHIQNIEMPFCQNFCYIKFFKSSDAAKALEECKPLFKPQFGRGNSKKHVLEVQQQQYLLIQMVSFL